MQCWASDPTLRFSGGLWYSLPGNHHFYNNLHMVIWVLRCFTTAGARICSFLSMGPLSASLTFRNGVGLSITTAFRRVLESGYRRQRFLGDALALARLFTAARLIQTPWRQESSLLTPCGRKDVGDPFTQASGVRFREDCRVPPRRGRDASQWLVRLACS